MKTVNVEKKLVDRLIKECTENTGETRLVEKTLAEKMKININTVLAQCTLCYFR